MSVKRFDFVESIGGEFDVGCQVSTRLDEIRARDAAAPTLWHEGTNALEDRRYLLSLVDQYEKALRLLEAECSSLPYGYVSPFESGEAGSGEVKL